MGADTTFVNPIRRIWAGADIGSLSAEAVIVDMEGILSYSIIPTGADSAGTARRAVDIALEPLAPLRFGDIRSIVATGYGRVVVPFARKNITELSCHAKGAHYLFPSVRTILDMGGQDCKAIRCDGGGRIVDFVMNDKCAAGTGRFLEIVARALEIPLGEIGPVSLKAQKECAISSRCAVFAKSEVLVLNRSGIPKEDILAGVNEAISDRITALLGRVGVEKELAMTGGVAKNPGVVKKLEEKLGLSLVIPPEPQIIGALGAALFARDQDNAG